MKNYSGEIDYNGRLAFLEATSKVFNPAPIENLAELLPLCAARFDRYDTDGGRSDISQHFVAMLERTRMLLDCRLEKLNDTGDGGRLRQAITDWMNAHRFDCSDSWIADAALFTLGVNRIYKASPQRWHLDTRDETNPEFKFRIKWRFRQDIDYGAALESALKDPPESLEEFRKRAQKDFDSKLTAYIKTVQGRWGARRLEPVKRVATWTARAFALRYSEIADLTNEPIGEDNIRKRIDQFAKRIRLTLPKV